MEIHIHIHHHQDGEMDKMFLEFQLLNKKIEQIMATLADIQAKNAALIEAVAAEDTVIASAVTLIEGNVTALADLKKQLADAIASNDPAAIQAVADSMDSTIADVTAKKQALADAVTAGTPAA